MADVKRDFTAADPNEERDYSFDFTFDLEPGETVLSAVWTCAVMAPGVDAGAAGHIFGAAVVDPTGKITSQRVKGLLPGCTYRLQAMATTSQTQLLSLYAHVECLALS